ncbi:helix-turn-helix domain-containing protein [Actinomycetospora straminea]|uniref:Helix-turn-helix transcriptional regulator n=1 Tax=Actinomycetospora straminea TaxID=663607 RepID=A0ABP9EUW7_9PSEU|nr:helix-turn-helix transcriptional regulator [Actinomycetospora straminea]MDD7933030.1 helix-turn-helix transcriptional regulator [Actinomycetospora straminea]
MSTGELAELARSLRTWRDRTDPAEVGMAVNAPRRAPGLRREELALLAGISIDYVVRLEQGRTRTPSAQVCASLARALRLSDAEQAHLFRLAGHAPDRGRISRRVPAGVRRIVDALHDSPVGVLDATWTLIAWNPLYAALMGDPSALDLGGRSTLRRMFTRGEAMDRVRHTPEERDALARSLVADLRGSTSRYPHDPELSALVADLYATSAEFAELWDSGVVAGHHQSHKVVEHPEVGEVELECDTLTTAEDDLRLLVFTPTPGSDARGRLDLLATLGTQSMHVSPSPRG